MKFMKALSPFLTFLLGLPTAYSQTPAPAAMQSEPRAAATPQGLVAQSSTPTIRARSNLVILDVVVTDRSHNHVRNLKSADFQVREGGAAQTVRSFEEHSSANLVAGPPMPSLPPGVFTNYTPTPVSGPVNVLLIDRLNTPVNDQVYLRNQLVAFVRSLKSGTRVAVFGLNNQLVFLQGFTSDSVLLLAALESKKGLPRQSPLLDPAIPRPEDSTAQAMQSLSDADPRLIPPELLANLRQFEATQQSDRTQMRVRLTLDAMNVLARYLSAIPGRKNLVWFSGSFPISILPDATGDLPNPFAIAADLSSEFRETTNLLSRSQVAVYPVDARGIQTTPMLDASQSGARYANNHTAYAKDNTAFEQKTADEHNTMRQMARDTGGQAFVNTNGLTEAVNRAIDAGSSYYTLTYTPTNGNYDGKFRKIQIDAVQHGLELSYRRGYYADAPNDGSQRQAAPSGPTSLSLERQATASAMIRGVPDSTQILFKALVVPAGPPTDAAVADGNVVSSTAKGPYRRYSVNYAAVPQDIALRTMGSGGYQAHLEFVVFVYDENGVLLNRFSQSVQAKLGPDDLKTLQGGIKFHQIVSVPVKGNILLRIGVHDLNVDRIGTVEVPISAVKNLAVMEQEQQPNAAPTRTAPTLNALPN